MILGNRAFGVWRFQRAGGRPGGRPGITLLLLLFKMAIIFHIYVMVRKSRDSFGPEVGLRRYFCQ